MDSSSLKIDGCCEILRVVII